MKTGYVYFMTNKPEGILYVGVTSDLIKRVYTHRNALCEGFSKRYELDRLVYFEMCDGMEGAISREKQLKNWHRQWKVNLISQANPYWDDLYPGLICIKDAETSSA